MADKRIKGLTVEIGGDTTKLGKALENVESKANDLTSELGDINRQLKFDPKNTELLTQKQKVLAGILEQTSQKLDKLKEAEKQVQEQFKRGEVSEAQVRALQREIVATESKMESYKDAVKETNVQLKHLGDFSEDTSDKMANALGAGLKTATAGLTAVVAGATAAAESTREYRADMGKLEVAFETAGHSSSAATKTYKELQGVLGDSGQAVEAANHLALLATNEEDLAKWTDIATGVYATFGASLPIEGLTEAANETAKVGQVTGPLADALNWAGVNEDKFNESLAKCSTEQERQALITSTLNGLYSEASTKYKETNADVIAANEANEKMTASTAALGEEIEPLLTEVKSLGAELLQKLVPVIDVIVNNLPVVGVLLGGAAAAMITFKIASLSAAAATEGMTLAQTVLNAVMNANPIGLVILAITALIAIAMVLIKNWDVVSKFFKDLWGKIKDGFFSMVDTLKQLPSKVISIGKDLVSGLWKGVQDKFAWLKQKLSGFATSVLDGIKDFFGVHSPSTKTAWIGEMLDEGMAKGVEDNADTPLKAMDRLSSEMLDEAAGDTLNVERRVSHTFAGAATPTVDSGLLAKLDRILAAVEQGKNIYLDSGTLVGATAGQYDAALGRRRVLAERGAI